MKIMLIWELKSLSWIMCPNLQFGRTGELRLNTCNSIQETEKGVFLAA